MRSPTVLHTNTVTAEAMTGRDAEFGGRTWADPVQVPCIIEERTIIVKAKDGTDVTSSTQIHAGADYAGHLVPESRVTLPVAPHRPAPVVTYVINAEAIITGDVTDGVTAVCE
jgi:hypothetical protein